MPENKSEVARILSQIREEYEAAQRGLSGLASGTSKHVFITTRMENMGKLSEELDKLVGDGNGMVLVIEAMQYVDEGGVGRRVE